MKAKPFKEIKDSLKWLLTCTTEYIKKEKEVEKAEIHKTMQTNLMRPITKSWTFQLNFKLFCSCRNSHDHNRGNCPSGSLGAKLV